MFMTLMIFIMILLIQLILFKLNFLFMKQTYNYYEKITPFECGFKILTPLMTPFSIQFYFMAILFLIFDLEIILIIPLIQPLKFFMLLNWLKIFLIIIFILLMGLYYEWFNKLISWFK